MNRRTVLSLFLASLLPTRAMATELLTEFDLEGRSITGYIVGGSSSPSSFSLIVRTMLSNPLLLTLGHWMLVKHQFDQIPLTYLGDGIVRPVGTALNSRIDDLKVADSVYGFGYHMVTVTIVGDQLDTIPFPVVLTQGHTHSGTRST